MYDWNLWWESNFSLDVNLESYWRNTIVGFMACVASIWFQLFFLFCSKSKKNHITFNLSLFKMIFSYWNVGRKKMLTCDMYFLVFVTFVGKQKKRETVIFQHITKQRSERFFLKQLIHRNLLNSAWVESVRIQISSAL